MIPDSGILPSVKLAGNLKLTGLGPTIERLYKLCTVWVDVLVAMKVMRTHSQARPTICWGAALLAAGLERREKERSVGRQWLEHHAARRIRRPCTASVRRWLWRPTSLPRSIGSVPSAIMRPRFRWMPSSCLTMAARTISRGRSGRHRLPSLHRVHQWHGPSPSGSPGAAAHPALCADAARAPFQLPRRHHAAEKKSDVTRKFQDYDTRFPTAAADGLTLSFG